MLSTNMICKRISDLEHENVPLDDYSITIHRARLDILYWIKNGEETKTESEIDTKMQRILEEQLAYPQGTLNYDICRIKLEELKLVKVPLNF